MRFASTAAALLAVITPAVVRGEDMVLDAIHNATSLEGTWSTGSMQVLTGAGFASPANQSFTYPRNTGVSFSFTNDGFFEISRYRFTSNATVPSCIVGTLIWSHGTYELLSNGSIVMTPFGDGYQQVQDPCAAVSNFIQDYNETELYQSWRIFEDTVVGTYKLHLFGFDGSPVAPQFQVSTTPTMLPTQKLRNSTADAAAASSSSTTSTKTKRFFESWF